MNSSFGRVLEDRLISVGLSQSQARTFGARKDQSLSKMHQLSQRMEQSAVITEYPGLTIFSAGSYARGEASAHSDVDLFFIKTNQPDISIEDPHLREIKIMSDVIHATEDELKFPSPSNDGEFLKILDLDQILKHLGGRDDDYKNHFTARMLLLLESVPIVNKDVYRATIEAVIDSYLRDYEDHAADFRPTFIVNDVIRFWKTLCLNYEHKRNQQEAARKIKQKIRNFKLAYGRLLTCFSTVSLLSNYKQITKDDLLNICELTPIERLLLLHEREVKVKDALKGALEQYHWFLDKTATSKENLEQYFSETNNRKEAFTHASKFGDAMYNVVHTAATQANTLRYLVV